MTTHSVERKKSVVQAVSLGQRVAEEERDSLAAYFVETEHWRRVFKGEIDVVFAPKGGGKSAIYSMLLSRENDFFDRNIVLAPGENPTGTPAFSAVEEDPPTTENEFVGLWKLYFLALSAQTFREFGIANPAAQQVIESLQTAGVLTGDAAKRPLVTRVMAYVKRSFTPTSVESTVSIDPGTGLPTVTGRIRFDEPSAEDRAAGAIYVDELLARADSALADAGFNEWLVLDRLDVAFADSQELEENALRALFRVYRDLEPLSHISLKIFLRSDIWRAITAKGFREASHITRELNISWSDGALLQLVVQRLVQSSELCAFYGVDPSTVLASAREQRNLFERVYPRQVEPGSRKPKTFDWCLARTKDGHGTAPRELIHLLSAARDRQLQRYEIGEVSPDDEMLFDRQALKDALPEVSACIRSHAKHGPRARTRRDRRRRLATSPLLSSSSSHEIVPKYHAVEVDDRRAGPERGCARMQEPRVPSAVTAAREEQWAARLAEPPFPYERRDLPTLISRAFAAQWTPCFRKSVDESEATQVHYPTESASRPRLQVVISLAVGTTR